MLRPAPGQSPVAAVCRRRTRASLQCGVHLPEALITHCHIRCVRLLPPQPNAAIRPPPPSAFDSALRSEPSSSGARLSAYRTPRGSTRSPRTQLPSDLLRRDFDAADAVVLIPRTSPFHFSIRTTQFIDGFALTLTNNIYARVKVRL